MTDYAAYLLKVWREPDQEGERIVLKNIHTGESCVLNSAESLIQLLSPNHETHGETDAPSSQPA